VKQKHDLALVLLDKAEARYAHDEERFKSQLATAQGKLLRGEGDTPFIQLMVQRNEEALAGAKRKLAEIRATKQVLIDDEARVNVGG
jgi:hypothetical protein